MMLVLLYLHSYGNGTAGGGAYAVVKNGASGDKDSKDDHDYWSYRDRDDRGAYKGV